MSKVLLVVRDGWGYSKKSDGNAILKARTPNHDRYTSEFATSLIKTDGNAVGNPVGTQGGSEVGHLTMGAGRVVWQPLELINRTIKTGEFFENKALFTVINECKKHQSTLHLNGLFSDQGIHAHIDHLISILRLCKKVNFEDVKIHLTLDGRDVPEKSAIKYLSLLQNEIAELNIGVIASLAGRFYSMDRDENWDRTHAAYLSMAEGIGRKFSNPEDAIKSSYDDGVKSDYFIKPSVIVDDTGKALSYFENNDGFVWFNFRSDRSRQITAMVGGNDLCPPRYHPKSNINVVCFASYNSSWNFPVVFEQHKVTNNLADVLATKGKRQLRVAETEKFAHVTFFFNSQVNEPVNGEQRISVDSPKVDSFDKCPEMAAALVTEKAIKNIDESDFILVNYANPDLVGHSGNFESTVKACEVVDVEVGLLIESALKKNFNILLTADHGNAENMIYDNGDPNPSHGFNPVLLTLISNENYKIGDGQMSDIAPTILDLMELDIPKEMTGKSLIIS